MKKKQPYLTSAQLAEELDKSQAGGQPTEKVCEYFRLIAQHLIGDSRYRNYSKELHEDMVSAALEKCVRNIKNYKSEYADRCFNYFVRCVETSFWETLKRHYRYRNIQRRLALDYADRIEALSPETAQQIRESQIEVQYTGRLAIRPGWSSVRKERK